MSIPKEPAAEAPVKPKAPGPFASFASSVLLVQPGEGRRTALCFLHLFLASAVFVMGRTVRDTLFLSRFSLSALPWMFVCYGVASAITVVVYSRFADRLPRDKMIAIWCGLGVATYSGSWVAVSSEAVWIYPVFYVWSEVFANLLISQFWTLANDLHDPRAAKRLFGTIGSARVLGVIAVGMGAGAVVKLMGTAQLLFVLAGLLVVIAVVALRLGAEPRAERPGTRAAAQNGRGRKARIIGDPYVNALSLMILFAFTALTLGDYQFKAIARSTYREDDLARFFSFFYAGTGIVSFLFQMFATPRLLARFGLGVGASVMPTVFGAASALLLLGPRLGVATVMKFADNGFQYTIHDTTIQGLYVPFAASVKVRTRAFLDAVVKPLAYGVGGAVLVVVAGSWPVERLSALTVGLVVAWMASIPLVKRRYSKKLAASLSARGGIATEGEERLDKTGRELLLGALSNPDPRIALSALDELADSDAPETARALERLATCPDPVIRVAALERFDGRPELVSGTATRALRDPVPEVRLAAVRAVASLGDEAFSPLRPLLDDEDRAVRSEALAAMLSRCGLEAELHSGARLLALYSSEAPGDRADAARVLGAAGRGVHDLLRRLLSDAELEVRRAAIRAAGAAAEGRLLPELAAALESPKLRPDAESALASIGEPAIERLSALLDAPDSPREARLVVPRILRRIRRVESYRALERHLADPDSRVRLRAASAMGALRRELGLDAMPLHALVSRIDFEISAAERTYDAWRAARAHFPSALMDEEMTVRRNGASRRILRLLELRYDRAMLRLVRESLGDPSKRSNAMEMLDAALDPALRSRIMPFLDARERTAAPEADPAEGERRAVALLAAESRHPNPYVALLALEALSRRSAAAPAELARELSSHPDPLVREGARLLGAAGGAPSTEVNMYSTIEKILLLRSVPLFEKLTGEDLAPLARLAEVEVREPGDVIFREGDIGDALYVVVRGAVEIRRGDDAIARITAPNVFGEMSVLDACPRSATAVAAEGAQLLVIGSEEFYEALQERFEVADGVIRLLSRRLREADEKLSQKS